MLDLISVPTIMVCTAAAMIANALTMTIVWSNSPSRGAAGYWAVCFALGATSGLLLAANAGSATTSPLAAICITLSYAMYWSGYRAFNNLKSVPAVIIGVPALWLIIYFTWAPLGNNPNISIMFESFIIACFSFTCAHEIYAGKGNDRLAMTIPATIFLTVHGFINLAQLAFVIFNPLRFENGLAMAGWWKVFLLETFLNVIVSATSSIVLIKERSEERHRIESQTDALTGIANRRSFFHQVEQALHNGHNHAVLAILDLDHFKTINDQYGHQAGDHVLKAFTHEISHNLPADAIFGRIGGEEFALYLPSNSYSPIALLESLCDTVAGCEIASGGTPIPLTVSIGAATIEQTGRHLDQLVAAADCALYAAKDEGRNRLTTFTPNQRLRTVHERNGETRVSLSDNRVSRRATRIHKNTPGTVGV